VTGYRKPAKHYRLIFDDDEYRGLEVVVRSASIGAYLDFTEMGRDIGEAGNLRNEQVKGRVEQLLDGFATALVEWNLQEDDGTPVPATLAGVRAQEYVFMLPVINTWLDAVGRPSPPLGGGSPPGDPTLEASLPMEVA
jgi:hypothetical protein